MNLYGQSEKFTIIILRGSGFIEYANTRVILKRSFKYNIQELGNITLDPNSSAIVYNEKANLELGGNNLQKISTKEINSKLKSVKSNSQTHNFIKYFSEYSLFLNFAFWTLLFELCFLSARCGLN